MLCDAILEKLGYCNFVWEILDVEYLDMRDIVLLLVGAKDSG